MPNKSEEPLVKVTLNLFQSDLEFLKARHGWGYSTIVRDLIHRDVLQKMNVEEPNAYGASLR